MLAGKKMAKREGEVITIDTLKEKNYSPLALRLLVFAHHYRSPIDFSWELLDEFQGHVESITKVLARLPLSNWKKDEIAPSQFISALQDDLNTSKAFAIFLETTKELNKALDANNTEIASQLSSQLLSMDSVIGILDPLAKESKEEEVPVTIQSLAQDREEAKKAKNYMRADALRQEIAEQGYRIEDTPQGPRIVKI